ncbi:hypothetical protein [Glycomyces sp. MUSA5-2]|uniref:hypothetical protein n=1 Tax=Glycomyces sp. MUSA5-2 TaxID=2053002 RepID=UPI003008FE40
MRELRTTTRAAASQEVFAPEGDVDVPLGEFAYGNLMEFFVLGDDQARPNVVDLYGIVADEPVHVLHLDDVLLLGTGVPLYMRWMGEGGVESGTAISNHLYGETIRVLHRARTRRPAPRTPAEPVQVLPAPAGADAWGRS